MPVGATIGAAVVGAGVNLIGSEQASNTQQQAAQNALKFQAQQEAQKQASTNLANQVQLQEYQNRMRILSSYLDAHNAVLNKYGIKSMPLPSFTGGAFDTLNAQPTTSAGVLAANPGFASLASGASGGTSMIPGLALTGLGAVGGAALGASNIGYQPVSQQEQLAAAGASSPSTTSGYPNWQQYGSNSFTGNIPSSIPGPSEAIASGDLAVPS